MIQRIVESLSADVRHRVWVMSDLQQSLPAEARRGMTRAMEDFASLSLPVEQVWYLGDAVEGTKLEFLEEMAAMQVEKLSALKVPVKYVLGNHDFDHLMRHRGQNDRTAIFRDAVRKVPEWRTTDSIESFYFFDRLGEYTVLFMSDHADPAGRWISTHGKVHGNASLYPYSRADYERLRDEVAKVNGPVITCSHYSFAGGNRSSDLHDQMFPLPGNILLHLYGHAHMGDGDWAGKDLWRKISGMDNHPIMQCDIASLEDGRGSAIRSAILQIQKDGSLALFFRNHTLGTWEEMVVLEAGRYGRERGMAP